MARQGGKANLVIGSRKCIAPLQTLLQGEFKSLAEQAGGTQFTLSIESLFCEIVL